jgi:hypothetical protein
MSNQEPVVIFAGNIVEAEFVKSLLESAGVPCFLKDENIGTIAPFMEPAGLGAVKLVIRAGDVDKARPIIEEYEKDQAEGGGAAAQ